MKKLRKKSIKTTFGLFFVCVLVGAILICPTIPTWTAANKEPIPWEDIDFEGDIDGLYVTGTLYGVYDEYVANYRHKTLIRGKTLMSKEFIIDANEHYYMGLFVNKEDLDQVEDLMNMSQDYTEGKATYEELEKLQFEVTGTITSIPKDSLQYYNSFVNKAVGIHVNMRSQFLPYYLKMNMVEGFTIGTARILCISGSLIILFGILMLILAMSGFYQKSIKKYIAKSDSPEMTEARVKRFFENTPETNGMYYNAEFICGQYGSTTIFGETPKIAWIYTRIIKRRRRFFIVSKTHVLVICYANGTRDFVSLKNESAGKHHTTMLTGFCPQAIFGYTDELDNLFSHSLGSFLNLRYNQRTKVNSITDQ